MMDRKLLVAKKASPSAPSGMRSGRLGALGGSALSLCTGCTSFHRKNLAGLAGFRSPQYPPMASSGKSATESTVTLNPMDRTLGSHSQYVRMKFPIDANTSGSESQMLSARPVPVLIPTAYA